MLTIGHASSRLLEECRLVSRTAAGKLIEPSLRAVLKISLSLYGKHVCVFVKRNAQQSLETVVSALITL